MKPTVQELKETYPNISDDCVKLNTGAGEWRQTARSGAYGDRIVNIQPIKKRSKYNVSAKEERTYNGITYDSKKEMNYYINTLEPLLKDGELDYVLYHVPFIVGNDPKTTYEADFVTLKRFWKPTHIQNVVQDMGSWIVEIIEVKGSWMAEGRKKIKLFRKRYPKLTLRIIE